MMRLLILHETVYRYSEPVHAIAMEARLRPCDDGYQNNQRYRLTVSPKTAIYEYSAFSDITIQHWSILKSDEVRVVAESIVSTRERSLTAIESPPALIDRTEHFQYLQPTALTMITPAVLEFSRQFSDLAKEDWYRTALAVREVVYKHLDYQAEVTNVHTTADQALHSGVGVCQDYTHLMITALRALHIPARYASGYLNPQVIQPTSNGGDHGNEPRQLRGTTASHAWVEVYMGGGVGWRGFCPTNNLLVDHHFVRIGAGRDYRDLTPIKGVHRGNAKEAMTVTVNITPLAEDEDD
jgi:transglutaminase-like putative cysteine protease